MGFRYLGFELCYRFAKRYYPDIPGYDKCNYECEMINGHAIYESISFFGIGKKLVRIHFTEDGCSVCFREFVEGGTKRILNKRVSFHEKGILELFEQEIPEEEKKGIYTVRSLTGSVVCSCSGDGADLEAEMIAEAMQVRYQKSGFLIFEDKDVYRIYPAYVGEQSSPESFLRDHPRYEMQLYKALGFACD